MRILHILVFLFAAFGIAFSDMGWGLEPGSTSMKSLVLPQTPRSAALAGAGLASPEALVPRMQISQLRFPSTVGADLVRLSLDHPSKVLGWQGGASFLKYDDIEGRDEDGFVTGGYGAGTWTANLGFGSSSPKLRWNADLRYAQQSIAGEDTKALLGSVLLGHSLSPYLSMAVAASNWGWMEQEKTYAPGVVQAGLSGEIPQVSWLGPLQWTWHTDLQRRADSNPALLLGLESSYHDFLTLRLGYPLREKVAGEMQLPSVGLGLALGPLGADYAYVGSPVLGGQHYIGLWLGW